VLVVFRELTAIRADIVSTSGLFYEAKFCYRSGLILVLIVPAGADVGTADAELSWGMLRIKLSARVHTVDILWSFSVPLVKWLVVPQMIPRPVIMRFVIPVMFYEITDVQCVYWCD